MIKSKLSCLDEIKKLWRREKCIYTFDAQTLYIVNFTVQMHI